MPRRPHWFPVSHDINSDPEVWELTDKFGVAGLRVWLELLSIGDRNSGALPPFSQATVRQLAIKCNTTQRHLIGILSFIISRRWVVDDQSPKLRKYLDYHITREAKKNGSASPPDQTRPEEEEKLNKEKKKTPDKVIKHGDWGKPLKDIIAKDRARMEEELAKDPKK